MRPHHFVHIRISTHSEEERLAFSKKITISEKRSCRATTKESLSLLLEGSPYRSYAYGYPHKTAYRPLSPAISVRDAWAGEDHQNLFLYLHVPFCEMRCGFCNLFTTTQANDNLVATWTNAVVRQAKAVRTVLGEGAAFARGAIGGGTPTFLSEEELETLLSQLTGVFGPHRPGADISVEMSPATVTAAKLGLLREYGMTRASLGVQSFVESEVRAAGRGQKTAEVERALVEMKNSGVRVCNIDLIYGIPGQTEASWMFSLVEAVCHAVEEIYLYPLYIRPLTGLGRLRREPGDNRETLYALGRDYLLRQGYIQVSLRLFRRSLLPVVNAPTYLCQEDGMIGLGPGARSYTKSLHYSSDYAVGAANIGSIINEFSARDAREFNFIHHGVYLSRDEQQRRYLIKSLLRAEGLNLTAYRQRFGSDAATDWPEVFQELLGTGCAQADDAYIRLTPKGMDASDLIGPWLYSAEMTQKMEDYTWS